MFYSFMSCSVCSKGSFDTDTLECNVCHTKYRTVINGARTEEEKKIDLVISKLDDFRILEITYEPVLWQNQKRKRLKK